MVQRLEGGGEERVIVMSCECDGQARDGQWSEKIDIVQRETLDLPCMLTICEASSGFSGLSFFEQSGFQ